MEYTKKMKLVNNTPTIDDAKEQLEYWKTRLKKEELKNKLKIMPFVNRSLMVYQTKLINTKEAA